MKSLSYMTRAMQAKDPRYADILGKLGYGTAEVKPAVKRPVGIAKLRSDYERVVGKKPFNGWNAEQLREKIAAAKAKA